MFTAAFWVLEEMEASFGLVLLSLIGLQQARLYPMLNAEKGDLMGAGLRLRLFGGLQATLAERSLHLPCNKSFALLAYLATTGRSHPRGALGALLWGDSNEARARASLRTALWHLRESVGPFLIVDRQFVAFDRDAPHWVDAVAFGERIEEVRARESTDAAGPTTPLADSQAAVLREVVELYRGAFLAGFDVRGAPDFEAWALRQREWARESAIWSFHRLIQYYTAQREYRLGLEMVDRLLVIAPWQEEAHRARMALLALAGHRGAALAQYATCRRTLAEALDAEPTLETELLYREIKSGRPLDQRRGRERVVRLNLPPWCPNPGFGERVLVGRDGDVARLERVLMSSDARLISLVGPAGVGKTQLAHAVAEAIASNFEHGAWFISLSPGEDNMEGGRWIVRQGESEGDFLQHDQLYFILSVGRALGMTFSTTIPLAMQLCDYLRHRELLLVLDEFTPLAGQIDILLHMLRQAPRITILIVSTKTLGVEDEQVFHLSPLTLPAPSMTRSGSLEELERIGGFAGIRLFVRLAKEASPAFEITPDNARYVVEICQLTDGLPLAIELAAAWVGKLPLASILADIEWRLRKMNKQVEISESPLAIEAIFSHVWDLLASDDRTDLARLVSLQGEFGGDVALEILGIPAEQLASLCERALLTRTGIDRYQMHPLLRRLLIRRVEMMRSREWVLRESVDTTRLEDRLSAYYLATVQCRRDSLLGQGAKMASAEIERDWWNVRRAWFEAVSRRDRDRLENSLEDLFRFLVLQGWFWEGAQLFEAAANAFLAHSEASGEGCDVDVACRLLLKEAYLLNAQMRHGEAAELAQMIVRLMDGQEGGAKGSSLWQTLEAGAQLEFWKARYPSGALAEARDEIRGILALLGVDGSTDLKAAALQCLGIIEIESEKFEKAQGHLEQALCLYENLNDWLGRSRALGALGLVCLAQRFYAEAEANVTEALAISEAIGDQFGEAAAHTRLCRIAQVRHDRGGMSVHCQRGLVAARDSGDLRREGEALRELSWVYLEEDTEGKAWVNSLLALEIARAVGYASDEGQAWLVTAHVFAELKMLDEAEQAYEEALQVQRKLGQSDATTESLAGLASLSLSMGRVGRARALVEEVLEHVGISDLHGARDPASVYLRCYQVLSAAKDDRAERVLQMGSRIHEGRTPG